MPEAWDLQLNAQQLVEQLEEVFDRYAVYNEEARQLRAESRKGIGGFFRNLFPTSPPMELEDQHFWKDAETITNRLAEVLQQVEEPRRGELAAQVVSRFLAPKPREDRTAQEWFLLAAEHLCIPLIPYLTRPALEQARDALLAGTPRRYLFPKQAELLKELETRLEQPGS